MKQSQQRKRWIYAAIIMLVSIAVAVWIPRAIFTYFNSGAPWITEDHSEILMDQYAPDLQWAGPISSNALVDFYIGEQIGESYLRAWQALNSAITTRDSTVLEDYFAEPLQTRIARQLGHHDGFRIEQADLSHTLHPILLSYDKQVIEFTDAPVRLIKRVSQGDTEIAHQIQDMEINVVMTLDDDRWRIRHFVAHASQAHDTAMSATDLLEPVVQDKMSLTDVRGVNYYPSKTPWKRFWMEFDTTVIKTDFGHISKLGMNTIRIFIPFEVFGGANVDSAMLRRMDVLLDLALHQGLYVIPTLFDFPPGFSLKHYAQTERHLKAILTRFRFHDQILAWDVKNEPDLDFAYWGRQQVLRWLEFVIERSRHYDPVHPITIGWSRASHAVLFQDQLDFLSFHDFDPDAGFAARLDSVLEVAKEKTVMLSEFGIPTYSSFMVPGGHSEMDQARYYHEILEVLRQRGNIPYLCWTLYDYPEVPKEIAGPLPWKRIPQQHYGLLRADGTTKPVVEVIRAQGKVTLPSQRFLERFHWVHLSYLVICLTGAFLVWIIARHGIPRFR
jgi:hypothetical protein